MFSLELHVVCGNGNVTSAAAGAYLEMEHSNLQARIRLREIDFITIRGQLLPVKKDIEGSDEEGDASDPEFLDAEEIEGGALQLQSLSPQNTKVKIKAEDSREYLVNGFFPLVDPWWCVTVNVKRSRSQYFVKGFPSYELADDMLGKDSILPLFLKACSVPDEYRQEFLDWMPHFPPVTFSGLMELAEGFQADCGKNVGLYLNGSGCGKFILKALKIPLVLKYFPRLLPNKVKSLLCVNVHDHSPLGSDLLEDLETILATAPWKLGFGSMLLRELNLCGCEATWESFLQCENLLERIPDLQLNALIIYNELKRRCMDLGDTYVEQSDLTKAVSRDMSIENAWESLKFLEDEKIVVREHKRIFQYNYYHYEANIAEYVKRLLMKNPCNQVTENDVFGSNHFKGQDDINMGIQKPRSSSADSSLKPIKTLQMKDSAINLHCYTTLDAEQQKAAKMILDNHVTVVSGKGGCGKTTVVSLVFRAVMQKENEEVEAACDALENDDMSDEWACHAMVSKIEQGDLSRVLLTAPTGKAASLLKKKTALPAATLHQITCSYSAWKKKQLAINEDGGKSMPWKFSKVEVLVVDEGSLVSVRIFSAALELLCKHAKLSKLVILGDVRQLPSIEPGNLLADMFAAFSRMNGAIELQTNHRAESQLIVDNATLISQQRGMEFDAFLHFDEKSNAEMPREDKKCILVSFSSESDLSIAIKALLERGPGLNDDRHSQFIAFRRKDCLLINELCCKHYAEHTMKNFKNRYEFRFRDKVCCTKNVYVKDLVTKSRVSSNGSLSSGIVCCSTQCPAEGTQTQPNADYTPSCQEIDGDDRICNGEVFYVTDDVERDKIHELTLFDGEDRQYILNYKALRRRGGLRHAWARTIHTFQGSEEDTVVYVLGTAGRQNWKHVYTAVTRGCKRVYIIAKRDQLDVAIANKARERKTRLQQHLKEKLHPCRVPQPATSFSTNLKNPVKVEDDLNPDFCEQPYSQHTSPLRYKCPPLPATPDVALSKEGCGDGDSARYVMLTTPGSSVNCESPMKETSSVQKRTGICGDDMETPSKKMAESPTTSTRIETLSIHGSCHKQLFKP